MPSIPFEEINQLVRLRLGARNVDASSRLVEDLRAESVDIMSLVTTVEERYGVTIKESELARIKTVGDLHALVQERAK
jgi:acyl carrier protein